MSNISANKMRFSGFTENLQRKMDNRRSALSAELLPGKPRQAAGSRQRKRPDDSQQPSANLSMARANN
jgi:hypothetical protein